MKELNDFQQRITSFFDNKLMDEEITFLSPTNRLNKFENCFAKTAKEVASTERCTSTNEVNK
jgi:hypothetical protein